jgi:hypothetical protein
MVHGDIDKAVDVSGSRNIRLDLIAGRHRFVYREIIGGDHTSNLLFNVPTGDDAARWVHHLRHKSVMPSQVDMDLLKGLFKAKEADLDVKLADPDIWKRLVRIGGPHAWAVIGKAMKSKAAAVRTAFAKACGSVSLEGEMTVSSLVKLLSDVDSDVRMASISSLGVLANWRGATAQSALARFASDSRMDDLERTAAAASLAAVLTLPLQGNLADDAPAIEGVLSLLDSDLESVRVAVASPLRIASQDSFGYDPSATVPSRKAAIAACRAWFAERSGKKSVTPKSK